MTAPGRRLHALTTRWCSERARRRLINPALADLQAEYAAARRTGSRPRMLWTLAANYVDRKWAMSLAPLPIVGLIVAIAFRRAWTRAGMTSVALVLCASHFALLSSTRTLADLEILPPIVLGWSADAICVLAALLLTCSSRYAATSPPAPTR